MLLIMNLDVMQSIVINYSIDHIKVLWCHLANLFFKLQNIIRFLFSYPENPVLLISMQTAIFLRRRAPSDIVLYLKITPDI